MTEADGTPDTAAPAVDHTPTNTGPPSNQQTTSGQQSVTSTHSDPSGLVASSNIGAINTVPAPPSALPVNPGGGGGGGPPGSSATTNAPLPTYSTFMPQKPRLGNLEQYDVGRYNPFTGLNGQAPNGTRTARADGSDPECLYSNQLRPLGSASQKSRTYRVHYDGTLITKKVKITQFKREFGQRGVEYGYDSIFWLKDQFGHQVNIITESDKFDLIGAHQAYEDVKTMYDKYCTANDHDATTYLLSMLDKELKQDVELFHNSTSGFVIVWYALLGQLYTSNLDRKRDIESQIRAVTVTQFAQQDISKMVATFLALCEELDDMDSYNHDNTVKILDCVSYAGGGTDPNDPNTLEWRHEIIQLKKSTNTALNQIRRLSLPDQDRILKGKGLHYRSILQLLNANYKIAIHNKAWPPARNQLDRQTPHALTLATGTLTADNTRMLQAYKAAYVLQQAQARREKPADTITTSDKPNPKRIPPGPELTPKEIVNGVKHYERTIAGKLYHWCEKCQRWSPTHFTGQHTGRTRAPEDTVPSTPAANVAELDAWETFDISSIAMYVAKLDNVEAIVDAMSPLADYCVPCAETVPEPTFHTTAPSTSIISRIWTSIRSTATATVVRPATTLYNIGLLFCLPMLFIFLAYLAITNTYAVSMPVIHSAIDIFLNNWYTWQAIAPWTWFGSLLSLIIGPQRMCTQSPVPRHLRRQVAKARYRASLTPIRTHQLPPYRHSAHQPSRSILLRHSPEGENHRKCTEPQVRPCYPPWLHKQEDQDPRDLPPYSSGLNFRHPRDCRHRNQSPSCRRRRRRHLSHVDQLLHRSNLRKKMVNHFMRNYRKTQREQWLRNKSEKQAVDRVSKWEMERAFGEHFQDILPEVSSEATSDTESVDTNDDDSHNDTPPGFLPSIIHLYNVTVSFGASIAEYIEDSLFVAETIDPMIPDFPVIWDSGASICVTFEESDFAGRLQDPPPHMARTKGINGTVVVKGVGYVRWTFKTTRNTYRTLLLPAVYIPDCTQRLLSTSALTRKHPEESINIISTGMTLSGTNNGTESTGSVEARVDPSNHLPTAMAYRPAPLPPPVEEPTSDDTTVLAHNQSSAPPPASKQPPSSRRSSKKPSKSSKKTSKARSTSTTNTHTRYSALLASLVEVSRHNVNLSEVDKEWLKWHQRLGHRGFAVIQFIMGTGILAKSQRMRNLHNQVARRTECPKCAACCYAKAKRRPVERTKTTHSSVRDEPKSLKADILYPGQEISVDHLVSSVAGRLYGGYGKGSKESMFKGSALFVDNATGFVEAHHQTALNSHETLRSKEKFEANCRDVGVVPQRYRSDNAAIFHSRDYKAHLEQFSQTQKFAGVGQHHANGIVEKSIQDIQSTARTMLVHLAIHWPDQADLSLWPMAIDHAVFLHNHLPNPTTGLSPMDKFSRQRFPHSKYHDLHVFGCPCYVLDKKIADGKTLPKFKPRSERHVYLGFSPFHASSVPLVLNPRTGAITAQFNCVFDDWFATIATPVDDVPDFMSEHWQTLFGDSEYQFPNLDTDPPALSRQAPVFAQHPMDTFDPNTGRFATTNTPQFELPKAESTHPPDTISIPPPSSIERESVTVEREQVPQVPTTATPQLQREQQSPIQEKTTTNKSESFTPPTSIPTEVPMDVPSKVPMIPQPTPPPRSSTPNVKKEPPITSAVPLPLRRSTRTTRGKPAPILDPNPHHKSYSSKAAASANISEINESTDPSFNEHEEQNSFPKDSCFLTAEEVVLTTKHPSYKRFRTQPKSDDGGICGFYDLSISYLGFKLEGAPHFIFMDSKVNPQQVEFMKASTKDPDTLSWDEAMSIPEEADRWREAALKEIRALESKRTWLERPESEATVRVIPGTWVFRRKRAPDGTITKFKARWVLRGDLQDIDMDTRADVVSWASVRMFMILSLKLGWTMKSIDFTNAFLHASLPDNLDMYVHLPRGFFSNMRSITGERTVLKMKKSCYGSTIAPRLWFEHLMSALLDMGFKPSSYDKCFLIKEDMLLVVYVDDCGISTDDPSKIDKLIEDLRSRGFDLELEGNFETFLGVEIRKLGDGKFHLLQEGLIKKVLETAGMSDCNPNHVPAAPTPLGKDEDGVDWPQTDWKYSSIVGMLIYLCTNTRPDISYAVSCAARFNAKPKMSHATAVKTILRYLKKTSDKGMIIDFNGTLELEAYCDADFAGLFKGELSSDPTSARSRGGYIIFLGNVPLIWKSSLLSCITLSTLEAEYMQLSRTITVLLGMKNMLEEFLPQLGLAPPKSFVKSTVFEDNAGALVLATEQNITNRTRYLNCRWHHFWSWIHHNKDGPQQDNPNGEWTDGKIRAVKVSTDKQRADIMTKGLVRTLYEACRFAILGW